MGYPNLSLLALLLLQEEEREIQLFQGYRHYVHLARLLWKRPTDKVTKREELGKRSRKKVQADGGKICWIQMSGEKEKVGENAGKCQNPGNFDNSLVTRPAIKG
jgi:hypothetical protein